MNLLYMGQKIIVHVLFTGTTELFTQLKIILLQYFQFLIFSKICSIQTLPIAQKLVALSLSN